MINFVFGNMSHIIIVVSICIIFTISEQNELESSGILLHQAIPHLMKYAYKHKSFALRYFLCIICSVRSTLKIFMFETEANLTSLNYCCQQFLFYSLCLYRVLRTTMCISQIWNKVSSPPLHMCKCVFLNNNMHKYSLHMSVNKYYLTAIHKDTVVICPMY